MCGASLFFILWNLIWDLLFVLGCVGWRTANFMVHNVNVTHLAERLHEYALVDTGTDVTPIVIPELPEFWNFGISGICDNFTATREVYCRPTFAPTHHVLAVLEESLRDSLRRHAAKEKGENENGANDKTPEDPDPELIKTVISSWNETLAGLSPSGLVAYEDKVDALWRAGAILGVGAVVADMAGVVSICAGPLKVPMLIITYPIGGLIALASASCVEDARRMSMNGPYGTNEGGLDATVGLIFGNSGLRLVIGIGMACYGWATRRAKRREKSATRNPPPVPPVTTTMTTTLTHFPTVEMNVFNNTGTTEAPPPYTAIGANQPSVEPVPESEDDSEAEEPRKEEVAYLGQRFVYDWLDRCELLNWSFDNWMSPLRSRAGFAAYRPELGRDHADFSYNDVGGQMDSVLRRVGLNPPEAKTYHFKVQATYGPCDERKMRLTEDQIRLVTFTS
ncbi:hypothetical protein VTJ49DRAFT_1606 [Mycothermus thermophilus]|uniref:Uncharacterized protein n=1 Tax=Humicola insolens TaxID=85995 RepID=A0ABR3VE14_HUMIN